LKAVDDAFRATIYRVFVPDAKAIDIRIGQRTELLDAILESYSASEWAFITAWNPGSRPLAAEENDARQAALLTTLRERGLGWFDGSGIPESADWPPEESVLVLGISQRDAVELGRRFGQLAIVVGKRDGAAELVYCADRPSP
jgi:hypothetical protein